MSNQQSKKINWRSFTSLYIIFSGIFILLSGVILYLASAGRVAKWTHLTILGLEKEQWQALHTIFTFLFIIASGFHLYYNWYAFVSYLRKKTKEKILLKKELFISLLLTVVIFFMTLFNVAPFNYVMDFGEYLTESWSDDTTEPPVPHAESMTFSELSTAIDMPAEEMLKNLRQNNINAGEDEIIKDVAERNAITPLKLFEKMKTVKKTSETSPYYGSGLGWISLADVCKQLNIELQNALQRLKGAGIRADASMILKDIAKENDKKPIDIMKIIDNKKELKN